MSSELRASSFDLISLNRKINKTNRESNEESSFEGFSLSIPFSVAELVASMKMNEH